MFLSNALRLIGNITNRKFNKVILIKKNKYLQKYFILLFLINIDTVFVSFVINFSPFISYISKIPSINIK